MRRPARTGALTITLIATLGGCAAASPEGPVADDVLFTQVASLPGVAASDLRWELNFGNTPGYVGTVTAEQDADPYCVLDQTLGTLYQGRQNSSVRAVEVVQGDRTLSAKDLVGDAPVEDRYGPRPSTPQPTATAITCTPPSVEGAGSAPASPSP